MMMLPEKKGVAAIVLSKMHKPEETKVPGILKEEETDHDVALTECMQRMCEYMTSSNYKEMGAALKDAFAILESMPHAEYSDKE